MRKTTIITTARPVARARVSESVVWERKPVVEYVPGPRSSLPPLIKTVTPPRALPAPPAVPSPPEDPSPPESSKPPAAPPAAPTSPPATRVEIVSVVESAGSSRGSRTSATSKSGRRSREEVYIERERETVRLDPLPKPSKDLDVFKYMEPPTGSQRASLESGRRSTTYGTKPRTGTRTVERERRLIVEDGSRRREYYH